MFFFTELGKIPRRLTIMPIGCGPDAFIGKAAWIPNLLATLRYKIQYVVPSRDKSKAEIVRRNLELEPEQVFSDFDTAINALSALERAGSSGKFLPDVIAISTETVGHAKIILAALRAGVRFVICDKPLVATLGEAIEIRKALAETGGRIFVTYNHVWNIAVMRLQQVAMTADGEVAIEGFFDQSWLANKQAGRQAEARLADPRCSLNDLGAHVLHGLSYISGGILSITRAAVSTEGAHGAQCIDTGWATLTLKNGAKGKIRFTQAKSSPSADDIGFVVRTEKGAWMWRLKYGPESLWTGAKDANPDNLSEWTLHVRGESAEFDDLFEAIFGGKQPGGHTIGWEGMWVILFLSIAGEIYQTLGILGEEDLPPIMKVPVSSFEQAGLEVTAAIESVVVSAGENREVPLDEVVAKAA